MSKGKGGGGSRASNNARSNSMNPNNASYRASYNNRSNQKNPNNPAYSSSRSGGGSSLSGGGGGSGGWGDSGFEEWNRLSESGALPELLNGAHIELRFSCECGCGGELQSARFDRDRVAPPGGVKETHVLEDLVCEESNFHYHVESFQGPEGPALRIFERDHSTVSVACEFMVSYGRDV